MVLNFIQNLHKNLLGKSFHTKKITLSNMPNNNSKTDVETCKLKANKLAGRPTTHGLIVLKYDSSHAALIELNCETEPTVNNKEFLAIAEVAANVCFKFVHTTIIAKGPLTKMCLDTERLRSMHTDDGKKLSERLTLTISLVGENVVLKRAECFKAAPGTVLVGCTDSPLNNASPIYTGKRGGILAYKCENKSSDIVSIGKDVCRHVVEKNPLRIGTEDNDRPNKNADNEECLIYQKYFLDPNRIVKDVLEDHKIHIIDFVRFYTD